MKKVFLIMILSVAMFSCADSKTFTIDGKKVKVEPYGWINHQEEKREDVKYKVCVGNVVWSVILSETVIAPVLFTGYAIYEPVELK